MPYTIHIDSKPTMLWTDRNGKMHSTLSGPEMLAIWDRAFGEKTNTDDFIENCQAVAEKTGNLNLFEEMFGQDSAFMDDNFGG